MTLEELGAAPKVIDKDEVESTRIVTFDGAEESHSYSFGNAHQIHSELDIIMTLTLRECKYV